MWAAIVTNFLQVLFLGALGLIVSVYPDQTKTHLKKIVAGFVAASLIVFALACYQAVKQSAESAAQTEKLTSIEGQLANVSRKPTAKITRVPTVMPGGDFPYTHQVIIEIEGDERPRNMAVEIIGGAVHGFRLMPHIGFPKEPSEITNMGMRFKYDRPALGKYDVFVLSSSKAADFDVTVNFNVD